MSMSVTYTNFLGATVSETRSGTRSYYVADTLGSTAALVNTGATVTDTWTYWPYGEVQNRTGTTATPFTFAGTLGYFQDVLNDLTYVRARFLRVALAGWQTVDRYWPVRQPYGYCRQRPAQRTDPSGEDWVLPVLGGLGGVLVGVVGGLLAHKCNEAIACRAALDGLIGAVVTTLLEDDPELITCLKFGGPGAIISFVSERLCDTLCASPPCAGSGGDGSGGSPPPLTTCDAAQIIWNTFQPCMGPLTGFLRNIIGGIAGTHCVPIGGAEPG